MNKLSIRIIIILLLCSNPGLSQKKTRIQSNDSLSLTSGVRSGFLPNGFSYFIKPLSSATDIQMKFLVRTGQFEFQQVAHIIEHLPFYGTKHFSTKSVNAQFLLENYGITEITATAGPVHTEYELHLAPDFLAIEKGLLWFKDIADLDLQSYDIPKEAKVIRQEAVYKMGDKIDDFLRKNRIMKKIIPCSIDHSFFFDDSNDSLTNSVSDFYHTYYRPDLMAIVIAGNIKDVDSLEREIKNKFSNLPLPQTPTPKTMSQCFVNYLESPFCFGLEEKKVTGWVQEDSIPTVSTTVYFRVNNQYENRDITSYKSELLLNSLWVLMGQRLREDSIAQTRLVYKSKKSQPFIEGSFKDDKGEEKIRIQRIVQLLKQMKNHGFKEKEWIRAQQKLIPYLFGTKDTSNVSYWINEIKEYFVFGEPFAHQNTDSLQQWFGDISIKDINDFTEKNINVIPDVSMEVPTGHRALAYTEDEIKGWIHEVLSKPIAIDYKVIKQQKESVKSNSVVSLISNEDTEKLQPEVYRNEGIDLSTGTEILILNNGLKVVLNEKVLKKNIMGPITIHGFRPKGAYSFSKDNYFSAINAPDLVFESGVGGLSRKELETFLSGSSIQKEVCPYIHNTTSGFRVGGSEDDLENMLQLIYLYFSKPNSINLENYDHWSKKARHNYFNPRISMITLDFLENIGNFMRDPNIVPLATKRYYGIKETDYDKANEIYKTLFGNASEFTFIIEGLYNKEKLIPLLQKYLGNLPSLDLNINKKTIKENGSTNLPSAPLFHEFYTNDFKPYYNMYSVRYALSYFPEPVKFHWEDYASSMILTRFLYNVKISDLRWEKGMALYNWFSNFTYNYDTNRFQFIIQLDCRNDELDWIRKEVKGVIEDIIENGIDKEKFDHVVNGFIPWYLNKTSKGPSSQEIYNYYRYQTPIFSKEDKEEYLYEVTPKNLQEFVKKYFTKNNRYEFVLKNNESNKNP